jgi:sarcosine oxidase, subunit beta
MGGGVASLPTNPHRKGGSGTKTAETVIIGAGVMGASVAYHLAARGCRDILVLERQDRPGLGSTGAATGGFRTQFGSAVNVRLSLLAREKLLRFRDELGVDPGYRPCGYLFMARTEAEIAPLRRAMAVQRAAGVREVREVTADDIRRLTPWVRADDLVGGTFCPLDGFLRPLEILRGYLAAAERLGVRIEYGTGWVECVADDRRAGEERRITGVRTEEGEVAARSVVNAAGPWAGVLGARAAIEIPVRPVRRQTAITRPFSALPEDIPMTICHWDGVHLRVRDGRVLLLWPVDVPAEDPFDTTFDPRWLRGLLPRVYDRFPRLADAEIDLVNCWAGLYEMSPDRHALLGPASGIEGLYLINGSSGHGVMHAPALGQLLAEMIVDGRARSLDVNALRPSRFVEGKPNPEDAVL